MTAVAALTLDFNGTLSDDEPILCEIFQQLFAARGRPLSAAAYYRELAGLSDEAIVLRWLGDDYPELEAAVQERVARYCARVSNGATIGEPVREAVRYAAARVPVVIVSGAAHAEIAPVVEAAGLVPYLSAIVSSDSVRRGKPDPEGYLLALAQLGVPAAATLAFEDSEAGVAAARAAGLRCIGVRGTVAPGRLRGVEELVEAIDRPLLERLLTRA